VSALKLLALTYGTEGDTRPIASLCRALMDAGHEVMLLAAEGTLGSAKALGVPHAALTGDIRGTHEPRTGVASLVHAQSDVMTTARAAARLANAHTADWMRQAIESARGGHALLVSGLATYAGLSVAEHLRLPALGLALAPTAPTAAFPSPLVPQWVPRWLNRASHQLVNAVLWRAFRRAVNKARGDVCGLPARHAMATSKAVLHGISRHLLPTPTDWPRVVRLCGQWTHPTRDWTPDAALQAFLDAGDPPVYLGFGSMSGFDPQAMLGTLLAGIGSRRALFYPGWSGADTRGLPPNVHVIGDTPHDWLFPRTAAVVHHGGSGTSHSAARAGVPSVVLPFAVDQFFWANRLRRLGVAPPSPTGRAPRADALARALDTAQSPAMRARAAELGAALRAEDGLGTAVREIEGLLRAPSPFNTLF
jgi:sterol 3beta-glucosyltransferase